MRHPLHSLCPYFAMFPENFVYRQILAYTERGDTVFDPFCGRGTTVLESLLNGRGAAGVDVNPVAACVAGAKADPPSLSNALRRLDDLEGLQERAKPEATPSGKFFGECFHPKTLQQILFLRRSLNWKVSRTDRFIAAVTLGCLHGESHKTKYCLSNRMPRTISTKPDYSVRWWLKRRLTAPVRDSFDILRYLCAYRLSAPAAPLRGEVKMRDARSAAAAFPELRERINLVVTSPPYLDTTDFHEDQWLRLWFLGGPERPSRRIDSDDRHTCRNEYWLFLSEAWAGCRRLFNDSTVIVVRIGGTRLGKADLLDGLRSSLEKGLTEFRISVKSRGVTTEIRNRQTNAFRPGTTRRRFEHDFVFKLS
jgi:hypothetical protein